MGWAREEKVAWVHPMPDHVLMPIDQGPCYWVFSMEGIGGIHSGRVSGADYCPNDDMASSGSYIWPNADWPGTALSSGISTSTM